MGVNFLSGLKEASEREFKAANIVILNKAEEKNIKLYIGRDGEWCDEEPMQAVQVSKELFDFLNLMNVKYSHSFEELSELLTPENQDIELILEDKISKFKFNAWLGILRIGDTSTLDYFLDFNDLREYNKVVSK